MLRSRLLQVKRREGGRILNFLYDEGRGETVFVVENGVKVYVTLIGILVRRVFYDQGGGSGGNRELKFDLMESFLIVVNTSDYAELRSTPSNKAEKRKGKKVAIATRGHLLQY